MSSLAPVRCYGGYPERFALPFIVPCDQFGIDLTKKSFFESETPLKTIKNSPEATVNITRVNILFELRVDSLSAPVNISVD